MLIKACQEQILFRRQLDTIRCLHFYIFNQTICILGRSPLPDTDLLSMLLSTFVQEFSVPTNGYSLYKLQFRDRRVGFIQLGC